MIARMTARFPYGILVVTDETVSEEIPSWMSPDEQVTSSASSMVLRVLHGAEGEVDVQVIEADEPGWGVLVHCSLIDVHGDRLTVGDALLQQAVSVPLSKGRHPVAIYADSSVEPSRVAVVIDISDAPTH